MLQNQLMVADALFGSESDFGMRYYAEGQWYASLEDVPEGLSVESEMHVGMDYPGTVCTSYARYLWARFQDTGLNVRVMGFSVDANPNCRFSREGMHPGGHDFLVIEGKFILDPWIKLFGLESELLFDVDSAKAVELYGCAENWVFMEGAENATLPDVSAIKAWQSKPFIFQQFVEMLKVWRTHQLRSFYNELS